MIDRLTKEEILDVNDCESLPTYKSYLLGKMTKSPFKGKGKRISDVLSLVHNDVCGVGNSVPKLIVSLLTVVLIFEYVHEL